VADWAGFGQPGNAATVGRKRANLDAPRLYSLLGVTRCLSTSASLEAIRDNQMSNSNDTQEKTLKEIIIEFCSKDYVWNKHDCISLLEHICELDHDILREPWMNHNHARAIAEAKRKYFSVLNAYIILLKQKHNFSSLLSPELKSVFLTPESGIITVCAINNNILRKEKRINLPFSIMGIVAEDNEHLYFSYNGPMIITPKKGFHYLWAA